MANRPEAWVRALGGGPRLWRDLQRAVIELACARWRHRHRPPADLLQLARSAPQAGRPLAAEMAKLVERVAFAVPRVAARVPWRADCFVQALAAQAWLSRNGVPTELFIGVRQDPDLGFQAHAWLRCGDRTVTGGDFSAYVPILTPDTELPRRLLARAGASGRIEES